MFGAYCIREDAVTRVMPCSLIYACLCVCTCDSISAAICDVSTHQSADPTCR